MLTELSVLWFMITVGLIGILILGLMIHTRSRVTGLQAVVTDTRRMINTERIVVVERQIQMIFDLIERRLASLLHAPHLPDMDGLLQKVQQQTITPEEAVSLYAMLINRREDLVIEGTARPDLDFPELFVLWSLEVRIARAGLAIPRPPLSADVR